MQRFHLSRRTSRQGFTLIELLIVIAIILILIAIALPNFLEAQERARVARGKAHLKTIETAALSHITTYGWMYSDYNESSAFMKRKSRNKNVSSINVPCPTNTPPIFSKGGLDFAGDPPGTVGSLQRNYYGPNVHCPLTTPIKFVDAAVLVDPWSDSTIPVGYDDYEESTGMDDNPGHILYGAYFVSGPDKVAGQWYRGYGAAGKCPANVTGKSVGYSPTNGTTSCGDMWVVVANDTKKAREHYDPLNSY
jgi:prepilin-type N-terminal cleavage/methylation domain-containing protein